MFLRSLEINHSNRSCPSLSNSRSEEHSAEHWEKEVKFLNDTEVVIAPWNSIVGLLPPELTSLAGFSMREKRRKMDGYL